MVDFAKKLAEAKAGKVSPQSMKDKIKQAVSGKKADPALEKKAEREQALVLEIQPKVINITINTPEQYQMFDGYLLQVKEARKEWAVDIKKITAPQVEALEAVYELNRKVDRPREALEKMIKGAMETFQYKLAAQRRDEERQKEIEAARLRQEAADLEAKAQESSSSKLRARLLARKEELSNAAVAVEQIETTTVEGANSGTRKHFIWKVTDLKALAGGVEAGQVPEEVIQVVSTAMNKWFKFKPEQVGSWPGIELVEDIKIVAGKGRPDYNG